MQTEWFIALAAFSWTSTANSEIYDNIYTNE